MIQGKRMQERLSNRIQGISESATLALNAAVQAMKAKGEKVYNLTTGEPDFNVPDAGKKAVLQAVNENRSKYTPVGGIPELRTEIAKRTNRQQPSLTKAWSASDVVVSNGGKQSIFNFLFSVLNPGDEVVFGSPYWLSYPEMVKLCGGIPVPIQTKREDGYLVSPDALSRALTTRTKAILFNSPSNPTGATYSKEEYRALADVLVQSRVNQGIWVMSDEIYDSITYGTPGFTSFLEAAPELRDCVVTVNGMSKSAAMTGWRVGWSVAESSITNSMLTLQGQSTSGINALAQWASVALLHGESPANFAPWLDAYTRRRGLALEILAQSGKLEVFPPKGAFYLFIGIEKAKKLGEDSGAFCERALREAQVALVPGQAFGDDDAVRISFATDENTLKEACERLVRFVETSPR